MINNITKILIERDGLTEEEAISQVNECRADLNERLAQGEMPFDILEEHFGLEPDYLDELLF